MEIRCNRIPLKRVVYLLLLTSLSIPALSVPPAAVPRKSPDFTIYEPSGKVTQLSSLRGKVVVIEFLFIRSKHCMDVIQTLNQLNQELGPRGFQPIAVAFNKGDTGTLVNRMEQYSKLTFPVGYTSAENVDAFFGRMGNERLNIPQIVVIESHGRDSRTERRKVRSESGERSLFAHLARRTFERKWAAAECVGKDEFSGEEKRDMTARSYATNCVMTMSFQVRST